jgi:FAD/FMN-containing dehydrogenase
MLDTAVLQELKTHLRGRLVEPSDASYDEARRVYNASIDRRPCAVAQCADVADVIAAVKLARSNDLAVAIRGGGHNVAGFGVCDDGIVVDLSRMKSVRVDPVERTVRVEGGATWGDVDHATHAFGLAVPGGIISTTGVGGLTLGGGIGHLTRKCGLSCDSLLSADVVLADGSLVTASEIDHPDLLWALRGGGGNYGVVTSFEFEAHEVATVVAGPILWDLDQAADAMRVYREFMRTAPDEVNAFFAFLMVPPGPPFPPALHLKRMAAAGACYVGPQERAMGALAPLLKFGPPALVGLGPMPLPALQSAFDALVPPGLQHYWKADFFETLSDEAIEVHLEYGPKIPNVNSAMHIYPVSGQAQRVGPEETAFSFRDADFSAVIAGMFHNPDDTPAYRNWVREYWSALHPYSAGGAYVNFMMDEGDERIAATYRGNYERLAEVKAQYDPKNLFHINQNIRPSQWRG